MNELAQFLVGGGFVGLIVGLLNFFLTRPKVRAEAAKIATDTSTAVIEQLRSYVNDLVVRLEKGERRMGELENRNDELEAANNTLERRNAELEMINTQLRSENVRLRGLEAALTQHLRDLSAWVTRYYDFYEANYEGALEPPPLFGPPSSPRSSPSAPTVSSADSAPEL